VVQAGRANGNNKRSRPFEAQIGQSRLDRIGARERCVVPFTARLYGSAACRMRFRLVPISDRPSRERTPWTVMRSKSHANWAGARIVFGHAFAFRVVEVSP
jgi:hypothetical protein